MENNYHKAYVEVLEVLKYIPKEDFEKVPKDIIETLKKKKDMEYKYDLNKDVAFENQILMKETKAILANFFRDYWATPEQRNAIKEKERKEEWEEEQNKIKIDYDAVFKRNTKLAPPKQETKIVVVEEKKWYEKFVDWIKNIFKRNG